MTHTIALLASGTLGDVAPFVALGGGLRAAGLRVRIVTHAPFATLVKAHRLEFVDLGPNPSDLLNADPLALTLEKGTFAAVRSSLCYVLHARPVYARMLAAAWEACRGADGLVVALPTLWGADIAAALQIPLVAAPLQPITPTCAWPSVLLPIGRSLGTCMNRLSHRLLGIAVWLPWRGVLNGWRARLLRLAPARVDHLTRLLAARTPFVYGFSPWLVSRPPDWPAHHMISGAWHLEDPQWRRPRELSEFLAAGPPPVYVGFGSMGARRPLEDAGLALAAARLAGRRLVMFGGPEAQALAKGRRDVCVVDRVSHEWLFPLIAAVVHHGGAGTTHAALRAGVPNIVAPMAADQYFWGGRVAALGAGPPPVPRHAIDAPQLARLIDETTATSAYRRRAAAIAELLRAEDGVARAVDQIRTARAW